MKKPTIYDGDMGGDDVLAIMLMLARPNAFDVKGLTTVFGNVDGRTATENAISLLSHFGYASIPVHQGALKPLKGSCRFGDDAYGDGGLGGVTFTNHGKKIESDDAVSFIIHTVMISPAPVTIFGTGPCTNIAHALTTKPELIGNIEEIILMGGAISPGPYPNPPSRIGNITLHSEFNFFQDPYAANIVLNSGARVSLMTMDASQNIHMDPHMRARLRMSGEIGDIAVTLLAPAEMLDTPKFGVDGPFIHDPNVILYALNPELYVAFPARASAEEHPDEDVPMMEMRHGKLNVKDGGPVNVIQGMKDPSGIKVLLERTLLDFGYRL